MWNPWIKTWEEQALMTLSEEDRMLATKYEAAGALCGVLPHWVSYFSASFELSVKVVWDCAWIAHGLFRTATPDRYSKCSMAETWKGHWHFQENWIVTCFWNFCQQSSYFPKLIRNNHDHLPVRLIFKVSRTNFVPKHAASYAVWLVSLRPCLVVFVFLFGFFLLCLLHVGAGHGIFQYSIWKDFACVYWA